MGNIEKRIPTPQEVKGIFADVYTMYRKYSDVDVMEHEQDVNQCCKSIESKYKGCEMAAEMVEAVLKVFIRTAASQGKISPVHSNNSTEMNSFTITR